MPLANCGRRRHTAHVLGLSAGTFSLVALGCGPDPCNSSASEDAQAQRAAIVDSAPPLAATVDAGLRDLRDWGALPHLRSDRYEQFSSRSRGPEHVPFGGKDFNNFLALLGPVRPLLLAMLDQVDLAGGDSGGYVLADTDGGPGYVSRMFLTRFRVGDVAGGPEFFARSDVGAFENEVLRIYVDDLSRPAFLLPVADLGATAPFATPFAGLQSGAVTNYVPISFTQRLRVTLDGLCPANGYFYQVDVKYIDEPTRPFSPRLAEDPDYTVAQRLLAARGVNPSTGATLIVDNAAVDLAAGTTATVCAITGGGTLEVLQFTVVELDAARLGSLQLLITYDDAAGLAVDVPLDAFFGVREQVAPFETLPLRVQHVDGTWELACYLPMPFATGARVAIRDDGDEPVSIRVSVGAERVQPVGPWGYLHARFHAVKGPQPEGSQFEVVRAMGRGRYVGTFLFAAGTSDQRPGEISASLNILEGNDTATIDGEPRVLGTGTEDYFNGGFYFAGGAFSSPFAAANYVKGGVDNDPGIVSCCRWHILSDALDFQSSFALRFQYGNDNPQIVVRYAAVAYYYLDRAGP